MKWLAVIPLLLWLVLYDIIARLAALVAFVAIVFSGRYPPGLFELVRGYIEARYRVLAYFPLLLTDRWKPGKDHPLTLQAIAPRRLSRWVACLQLPAMLLSAVTAFVSLILLVLLFVAVPIWWIVLFTGKYPRAAQSLVVRIMEWTARMTSWQFFMTDSAAAFGTRKALRWGSWTGTLACGIAPFVLLAAASNASIIEGLGQLAGLEGPKSVVHNFMVAGRNGDAVSGSQLTVNPVALGPEVEELFSRRPLFEGYQSITVTGWNRMFTSGQPDVFEIEGRIRYANGPTGMYYARLINVQGQWLLAEIRINRPDYR